MSLVYLKNKKNGVTYVYECVSFWNKEKKRSDSNRTCIGKLDPSTGEIIKSKRAETADSAPSVATVKTIGSSILFDHICKKVDLNSLLKRTFPNDWQMILSLAYFLTLTGKALSKAENWSLSHQHPYQEFIDNRRISDILPTITEEKQLTFFKLWAEKRLEEEYLAYDITSISSYSELNEMVRYGYNRDGDSLPQINLAMLFGEKTRLPVFYKSLPGSINDVSTLHNFLKTADFLNIDQLRLVMDKGFFSKKNIDDLFDNKMKFTIAVPFSNKFAKEQIELVRDNIADHKNLIKVNDQNLFHSSSSAKWGKKRVYVHVYYNALASLTDYDSFLNKMHQWEEELKTDKLIEAHEAYYEAYFVVKTTPKRGRQISYNQDAINGYKKNAAGFLVLLSNDVKDSVDAIKIYRNKDVVEKSFDNLKNALDMKRLRVHQKENMKGRLFIQFIALILTSYIHQVIAEKNLFKFGCMGGLLEELDLLNEIKFAGRYGKINSELTKKQKEIFSAFGIKPLTSV